MNALKPGLGMGAREWLQRCSRPWLERLAHVLPLCLCVVSLGQGLAQEPGLFSIRQHPGYEEPEKQLGQLVDAKGTARTHHFCVVGYQDPSGYEYAWVRWDEGRALILWEPAADAAHPRALALSRRFLRLDQDVVTSEDQVAGSSYRVTRGWVEKVARECEAHGDKFVISKRKKKQGG